jgi:hypothetical protein
MEARPSRRAFCWRGRLSLQKRQGMIPKSCRLFGLDHAVKKIFRAISRGTCALAGIPVA